MKKTTTTIRVHGIDLLMDHEAIASRMVRELDGLSMFKAKGWKKERRFLRKMGPAWKDDDFDKGRTYVCLCGDRFPIVTTVRTRKIELMTDRIKANERARWPWLSQWELSRQIPNPPDTKELARAIRHARMHLRKKTALRELFDQHTALRIMSNPRGGR